MRLFGGTCEHWGSRRITAVTGEKRADIVPSDIVPSNTEMLHFMENWIKLCFNLSIQSLMLCFET